MIVELVTVAAMLTGRPGTQVSPDMSVCAPKTYGCAEVAAGVIHMEPYLVAMLRDLEHVQPYQASLAVFVFGHEATHLRGVLNESKCDTWSAAHVYRIARLLGADDRRARLMLRWLPRWRYGRMP